MTSSQAECPTCHTTLDYLRGDLGACTNVWHLYRNSAPIEAQEAKEQSRKIASILTGTGVIMTKSNKSSITTASPGTLSDNQLLHKWFGGMSSVYEEKIGRELLLEIAHTVDRRREKERNNVN